ncbi:MAG: mechanosensitive ion channel family protein [bacterium]
MDRQINLLFIPAITAVAVFATLLVVRAIAFKLLHRWADRTHTKFDDMIIHSVKLPSLFWCIAISLYVGIGVSDLPEKYVFYITKAIYVVLIFSVTIASANLSGRIFRNYLQISNLPIPTTGLFYGILKGAILVIGILIILSVLGVSITPLITALGVGGLAVALALQDTLANLFAGLHILVERSIRVGDFIRLETGQEGYVDDITWRTTRIRMLPNNIVVIPNSKLSQSIVTNYYLPEKRMALLIPVSVSYSCDPEEVEKLLLEVVNSSLGNIDGLLTEPQPAVKFIPGFGESSLDFTVVCHVREFTDQYPVQHELRKRIFKRFKEAGIEIPFPQRVVHLKQ